MIPVGLSRPMCKIRRDVNVVEDDLGLRLGCGEPLVFGIHHFAVRTRADPIYD